MFLLAIMMQQIRGRVEAFFAVLILACVRSVGAESVKLVVGFCPSAFSGKGAVVSIDPTVTKPYNVVGTFSYPDGIDDECLVLEDMTMTPGDNEIYLSFSTHWGLLAAVDYSKGNLKHSVKGHSLDEYVFDGFSSMHIAGDSGF